MPNSENQQTGFIDNVKNVWDNRDDIEKNALQEQQYLNLNYARVDDESKDIVSTNAGNFKITIFLSKKYMFDESNFSDDRNIFLKYNDTVKNIYLIDDLSSIGLHGYIDVKNTGSFLDMFLGRHNNYYLVINITEYDEMGKLPKIKYEPYIFDISSCQNLTTPKGEIKGIRLGLIDCFTSIMKNHSIVSVIKRHPNLTTLQSYKEVFEVIIGYVKEHIKINSTTFEKSYVKKDTGEKDSDGNPIYKKEHGFKEKAYELKKDIYFGKNVKSRGTCKNGNDIDAELGTLIKESFSKIKRNASIYEAMQILLQDACTSLKSPESFTKMYGEIGDVLIPFYLKEEYPDRLQFYNSVWYDEIQEGEKEKSPWMKNYNGNGEDFVLRPITMRDIYMPFYIAWGGGKKTGIYEDINPNSSGESDSAPINGYYQREILAMQFNPVDVETARKIWKNVIFLDTSSGGCVANSTLIFFSWFFDFFQNVFLNENGHSSQKRVSNVQPSFHMYSRNIGLPHAENEDNTFNNRFDEYNSYTYASESNDIVKECLRLMGKNVASFVLLNDSYIFKINGDMFRRPNEIVKFGFRGNLGPSMQELSMHTDINFGDHTYLYVKQVVHQFIGNDYYNEITGCKICEVLE